MSAPAYAQSAVTVTSGALTTTPNAYHGSLFGGWRAHADLVVFERLHDYPGPATAYDPDAYGFDSAAGGAASHQAATGSVLLAVPDGTVGGKARLRSHDVIRYQPGCEPVVQVTGVASAALGTLRCVRRSSATGVTVDTTEATVTGYSATVEHRYEVRYAYLGVQTVQWWIDGALALEKTYAGALTVPYLSTPHLPISVEVVNVAADRQVIRVGIFDDADGLFFEWERAVPGALSFAYKCSSGRLVGGGEYPFTAYTRSHAATGVAATLVPLWSMRVGATLNGIASRVQAFPTLLHFFSETQPGALEIVLNGTLTGATWAATSPSGAVQVDTAATVLAGGTSIFRVGQGQNASATYDLRDLFTVVGRKLRRQAFTGTADVLTFAVRREGAVSFDPRVTCTWRELR